MSLNFNSLVNLPRLETKTLITGKSPRFAVQA